MPMKPYLFFFDQQSQQQQQRSQQMKNNIKQMFEQIIFDLHGVNYTFFLFRFHCCGDQDMENRTQRIVYILHELAQAQSIHLGTILLIFALDFVGPISIATRMDSIVALRAPINFKVCCLWHFVYSYSKVPFPNRSDEETQRDTSFGSVIMIYTHEQCISAVCGKTLHLKLMLIIYIVRARAQE